MKIHGNVIWITGASSGIGESLVYEMDKRGAKIIISARREEVLKEVKSRCKNTDNIRILTLDLEKTSELDSKAKEAISLFGKIDILVNNGGLSQRSLAIDTSIDVDERLMKINYIGSVALSKSLLPHMVSNKSGQIVTVSSMVGKFGTPLRSSYAATKHALHGFMDSLRAEVAGDGIFISMVCPGFVATNVSLNALTGDGKAQGTMDTQTSSGINPKDFATSMADAIESNKREVYIAGFKEKFGLYVSRFIPSLFHKLIKKMAVT
jgi:short-subunit dehydrogenase